MNGKNEIVSSGTLGRDRRHIHVPSRWKLMAGVVVGLLAAAAVFMVWSVLQFGSPRCGFAYVSGYSLYPEEWIVSAGELPKGREGVFVFRLRSLAAKPITVLGAKIDCGCARVDDLPLTIRPGAVIELRLRFVANDRDVGKRVQHLMVPYLDVSNPTLTLVATANISP